MCVDELNCMWHKFAYLSSYTFTYVSNLSICTSANRSVSHCGKSICNFAGRKASTRCIASIDGRRREFAIQWMHCMCTIFTTKYLQYLCKWGAWGIITTMHATLISCRESYSLLAPQMQCNSIFITILEKKIFTRSTWCSLRHKFAYGYLFYFENCDNYWTPIFAWQNFTFFQEYS